MKESTAKPSGGSAPSSVVAPALIRRIKQASRQPAAMPPRREDPNSSGAHPRREVGGGARRREGIRMRGDALRDATTVAVRDLRQ